MVSGRQGQQQAAAELAERREALVPQSGSVLSLGPALASEAARPIDFEPDTAEYLARIALGHVGREYPNKLALLLNSADDLKSPRQLYPLFWGSFDWHSCVHAHWLLASVWRHFPQLDVAVDIWAHFCARFTPEAVAGELAQFDRPLNAGFERPYGWAWLLKLASELHAHPDVDAARLAGVLQPLVERVVEGFVEYLPKAAYPVRGGAHFNTAFALVMALDYARVSGHAPLTERCRDAARRWYAADYDMQAAEPSGDDFLSPLLTEALAMKSALPGAEFNHWFSAFLPRLHCAQPQVLLQPVSVSDRRDGKIAHLDGLNLSRAWCWRRLAADLDAADPRRPLMLQAAEQHLEATLGELTTDYMGEHWLASFAWLALSA